MNSNAFGHVDAAIRKWTRTCTLTTIYALLLVFWKAGEVMEGGHFF